MLDADLKFAPTPIHRMRRCIDQSNGLVSSLPSPSWLDCIINTSGYDFRKGQGTARPRPHAGSAWDQASVPQQRRRSLWLGLSAAAVTDFAIGNLRGCSGEIRVDHLFRQRGALDRREDPVHSTFFPIPVVAAARSSRAPIWTAA
jgi:hypothetical protein